MGIGTGSLSSDVELFEVGGDTDRNDMVRESMPVSYTHLTLPTKA